MEGACSTGTARGDIRMHGDYITVSVSKTKILVGGMYTL